MHPFLLIMCVHLLWGFYPPTVRYLQTLPHPMRLAHALIIGGILAVSSTLVYIASPGQRRKTASELHVGRVSAFRSLRCSVKGKGIRDKEIAFLIIVAGARALTNMWAASLISSVLLQLFTLSCPFFVAIFGRVLSKEDPIPRGFFPALVGSIAGGFMILIGSEKGNRVTDRARLGGTGLGIGLATLSAGFLALLLILIRRVRIRIRSDGLTVVNLSAFLFVGAGVQLFDLVNFGPHIVGKLRVLILRSAFLGSLTSYPIPVAT